MRWLIWAFLSVVSTLACLVTSNSLGYSACRWVIRTGEVAGTGPQTSRDLYLVNILAVLERQVLPESPDRRWGAGSVEEMRDRVAAAESIGPLHITAIRTPLAFGLVLALSLLVFTGVTVGFRSGASAHWLRPGVGMSSVYSAGVSPPAGLGPLLIGFVLQACVLPVCVGWITFDHSGASVDPAWFLGIPVPVLVALGLATAVVWPIIGWLDASRLEPASRQAACPNCGYGLHSAMCPECGWGAEPLVGRSKRTAIVACWSLCVAAALAAGVFVILWSRSPIEPDRAAGPTRAGAPGCLVNTPRRTYLLQGSKGDLVIVNRDSNSPAWNGTQTAVYYRRSPGKPLTLIGDAATWKIGAPVHVGAPAGPIITRARDSVGGCPALLIEDDIRSLTLLSDADVERVVATTGG